MKTKIMICTLVLMLSPFAGSAFGGTEGYSNTFYGRSCGTHTTDDNDKATFIGWGAGFTNTSGNQNTFVGFSAGYANTTADENTFIGSMAGSSNTEGQGNTFVGKSSGTSNTTGSWNAFYGVNAGSGNTTGNYNSFFGRSAGDSNTGHWNSFFGASAGSSNTTGLDNAFFGESSGFQNTTGGSNSFFGRAAGMNNSTGFRNSFIGNYAGSHNSIEDYNTFIGYSADLDGTTDSVTNATAIGARAYVAQSNSLVLGSIAGLNDATSNVNVGIGTPAPVRQLHLAGANAVFRMDRNADTAAFILVRTDGAGNPLKSFVVGANASGSNNGEFVINDLGTAVGGPGTRRMTITNAGNVTFAGTVTAPGFFPTSSMAYKTHVRTYENALDTVNRLRGVRFDWKESGTPSVGLIAEEVEGVVPEVVLHDGGTAMGINYDSLVGVLVEAVKEQQAAIAQQQEAITKQNEAIAKQQEINAELKAEINRLKSKDLIAQR